MVLAGQRSRHRDSLLSRASAPDAARAQADARSRRRHRQRMHAYPATRGGPRSGHCIQTSLPKALAGIVWLLCADVSGLLQAKTKEPKVRAASAGMVRAGPPGRRLCGDVCRVADAALALAASIQRLAGVAQAGIY